MRDRFKSLLCLLVGHREETTELLEPDGRIEVTGCTRCDRTLDVSVWRGQYPLPR